MENNLTFITADFGIEVRCYFKNINGGVYDVYISGKCIVTGISENELLTIKKILKLNDTNSK